MHLGNVVIYKQNIHRKIFIYSKEKKEMEIALSKDMVLQKIDMYYFLLKCIVHLLKSKQINIVLT